MQMDADIHVWGIGNDIMGDDGVGIFVAKMLRRLSPSSIKVRICESVPENFISKSTMKDIRKLVIVDAAQMSLPPGSMRRISPIEPQSFISTHGLSFLRLLNHSAKECELIIIGIQPAMTGFSTKLSPSVRRAARELVKMMLSGRLYEIPPLTS